MNFSDAYRLVGLAEGKYTNDWQDPGGETICGLARNKNPDLAIWPILDKWKEQGVGLDKLDAMARADRHFMALVAAVYKGRYWDAASCDLLPNLLRYPVFSCAVNCGAGTAIKILQRACGVEDDGKYGNITHQACRIGDINARVRTFCDKWLGYYDEIIKVCPGLKKYKNGWRNRVYNVLRDNF